MTLPGIAAPTKVPVECLRLDRQNPRLTGRAHDYSEEELIAELYRTAELDELLQSMSSNGYLDIEPLVVVAEQDGAGLVVLEGNRRLATIRLLCDPHLVSRIREATGLSPSIPTVPDDLRSTFDQVTVYRVSNREQARPLIGFKHINGPQKWDAYAKAQFAAKWYRDEEVGLNQIARAIGDRHDTIKRMVSAVYVLEQARTEELFTVEDRYNKKFSFSHLYTSLSRSQYMEYLGLPSGWTRYDPEPNPVPSERMQDLRQVLRWIYGSKSDDERPVVKRQNPDIKRLGEVLAKPEAVHELTVTGSLDRAHGVAASVTARFTKSLIEARRSLSDALVSVRGYDGSDESLLDVSRDAKVTADALNSTMTKKYEQAGGR